MTELQAYVANLKEAPLRMDLPANPSEEPWDTRVARISREGAIGEITENDYDYWLEVLPVKWMRGSQFCFAEGAEALRLFWREQDGRHFGRQLTWDETIAFCRLAGIPLPS